MDTAKRDIAAKAFIAACERVYGGKHGKFEDLCGVQTIADYLPPLNQQKYVHMYFAKYVGLWRAIRQQVPGDAVEKVYSAGAGPCLDLFGWFWDIGPSQGDVVGVDPLPWSAIRTMNEWQGLVSIVIPTLTYAEPYVIPDAAAIPQCDCLQGVQAFPSAWIPNGTTVLFPFSLNHAFGLKAPADPAGRNAIAAWIAEVRSRDCRVVIADLPFQQDTEDFWKSVGQSLAVGGEPAIFFCNTSVQSLGPCYLDGQARRRVSNYMCKATVLVLDQNGGRFVT